MKSISISSTKITPEVNFNAESGELLIKGRSLPEQAYGLYKPIIEWLDEYVDNPRPKTTFNIHLEYFNSSSNKYVLLMLKKLDNLHQEGHKVQVKWFYDEDDEDSYDTVCEYKEVLDLPIEIIKED